jgi:MFS family permease
MGIQFLATMLVMYPISILMQKKGRKIGFAVGGLSFVIAGCVLTYAVMNHSYGLFCVGLAFTGIALGAFQFLRFAAIDVVSKAMSSKAVSWVLVGGLAAAFIGPNLASYTQMKLPAFPFAASYLMFVPIGLVILFLVKKMAIPLPTAQETQGESRPLVEILKQPVCFVAIIGALTAYGVMNLIMTSTPLAMHDHGFTFGQTAIIIQWHVAAMFAPSFFTGSLITRYGKLPIMFIGVLCLCATVLINNLQHSMLFYWAALVLLGLGWNFLFIGSTTLLQDAWLPAEKGKVQGVNDTIVHAFTTATAFGAGLFYSELGWQQLNLLVVPLLLLIAVLIIWLGQRRRPVLS